MAGVIALSTYLPLQENLASEADRINLDMPIFMAHGQADDLIPLRAATNSRDFLLSTGYRVEWHEYPMRHAVCDSEIADIRNFIVRNLGLQ